MRGRRDQRTASTLRWMAAWMISVAAPRKARIPSGPRRKAENIRSPVPASASIWAGFMANGLAIHGPAAPELGINVAHKRGRGDAMKPLRIAAAIAALAMAGGAFAQAPAADSGSGG